MNITINNTNYNFEPNQTILDVCNANNIKIPTLCHVKDLSPYGSCFVCVVEVMNGRAGIYPSCATSCMEDMVVETDNARVKDVRKMALELLLSDHYGDCVAPCTLEGCPANINIQGFLALESEDKYIEAAQLIRQQAPMPNILGRVCPAPCEDVCRRSRVDEAISIRIQKRFISDKEIGQGGPFLPNKQNPTNKKVTIIGAGPAGITAAYFLALEGHDVQIYEAHPKHGGMARYGIPYYRLPAAIIDIELNAIIDQLGIKISYNTKVGTDISFDEIDINTDAILLAMGAQVSSKMNIPGEDNELVIPAVRYLEEIAKNQPINLGKETVIVGGGHTAMDAARTAIRMGSNVTVLYRRSETEMPGKEEIEEAIEEGVDFNFLTAPISCKSIDDTHLLVKCIRMELSEPDESGRRRPVAIKGSEYELEVNTMVMAIGQKVDASFVPERLLTKWGTPKVDKTTFKACSKKTNPYCKIFAAGDCVTGPDLIVTAVAAGRKAAVSINQFLDEQRSLSGVEVTGEKAIFSSVTDKLEDLPEEMFAEYRKEERMIIKHPALDKRRTTFADWELPATEDEMKKEANRCLSCGCVEINECKLKEYSEDYNADPSMYAGEIRKYDKDKTNDKLVLENDKCINCGSCIRTAESQDNYHMLGLTERGFTARVKPPYNGEMKDIDMNGFDAVVQNCPTAGIRLADKKIKY